MNCHRMLRASVTSVGLLLLCGCQLSQPKAREAAQQRWNLARAEIKARLASDRLDSGHIEAASDELAEAERLVPDQTRWIPLRARILLAEGNLAQAERLLTSADLPEPAQAEAAYLRGTVHQQREQWDAARQDYEEAFVLDASDVDYLVAVAQCWLQLGQPDRALALLNEYEANFGWTDVYHVTLAECHELRGDWSAAVRSWQRVASGEEDDAEFRFRLARALYHAGRYSDALPLLEAAVATDHAPFEALRFMLAESYLALRETKRAAVTLQPVLQAKPDHVGALRLLARCAGQAGDYLKALQVAQRALQHDPHDPPTLELVTALAHRVGDAGLAVEMADRLAQRDGDNPVAAHVLATYGE